MSCAAVLPDAVRDKLTTMARQRRQLAAVRGAGEFLLISSLTAGGCLFADHRWNLSSESRTAGLALLAATLILAGWLRLVRPILRRRPWAELAAAVERQHPELSERLTTLVELQAESSPGRSPLMQELLARQTVKAVSQVDFTQALPARKSVRRAAAGLTALAILLWPFLIPGGRYALSWHRLLNPWGNYDWGHRLAFQVIDGDRVVAKGSDVTLQAQVAGLPTWDGPPLDVRLQWTDAAGHAQQRTMTFSADQQLYSWTIPRVEQSLRYRLKSAQAVSRTYQITAADRPRIIQWMIDVQPPAYSGLPAQSLDAVVGELRVPERSRIRFEWTFAEPVASASLGWPQSNDREQAQTQEGDSPPPEDLIRKLPLDFSADRCSATIECLATASGLFTVELVSELGLRETSRHELTVLPDAPPDIALRSDEAVTTVRPDDVLPIRIAASDDYGLTAVELHWQLSAGGTGLRSSPAVDIVGTKFEQSVRLDLSELNLPPDQTITFRARAVDNRPVPAPQETWSEPWDLAISSQVDALEKRQLAAAEQSLQERLDALEQSVSLQKQAVDTEHRDTARQAVRGDMPPANQEELARLEKRQEELLDQLELLRDEIDQRPFLKQLGEEHWPELERQFGGARQKLVEASDAQTAREQIERLSQSLDDLSRAEDQLAKLKQQAKALAALEQELAELGQLSRQAEKLADRAEQLDSENPEAANPQAKGDDPDEALDQLAKSDSAVDAAKHDALRQETGELNDHLADLVRRRPELLESAQRQELERLERLAEFARRLSESQAQLARAIDPPTQDPESNKAAASSPDSSNDAAQSTEQPRPTSMEQTADRLANAARQQQQIAREAARLQREAEPDEAPEAQDESPRAQFAEHARTAAQSAQQGDLEQAAEQSRLAREAARAVAPPDLAGDSQAADAQRAQELAQRQAAVAEELSQLAQSLEARQAAQQQGQERLSRTAEALAEALEQSAERLSQRPLNLSEPGQNAAQARQLAQLAGEAMQAALESLADGDAPEAGEQARTAGEQLHQAAQQAAQGAGVTPETSSQGRAIPGEPASRVAEAAAKLQQAHDHLSQAGSTPRPDSAPTDGSPAAAIPPGDAKSVTPPEFPDADDPLPEDAPQTGDAAHNSPKGLSSEPSAPPQNNPPSTLKRSAAELRQAAQAMSAACDCLKPGGRRGPPGKRGSQGPPGTQSQKPSAVAEAGQPSRPQTDELSDSPQGFAPFGAGTDAVGDEVELLWEASRPAGASRNWGRLPKHLQTEIRQGATKKPHPEYSRQIKRYFERIARPAERSQP